MRKMLKKVSDPLNFFSDEHGPTLTDTDNVYCPFRAKGDMFGLYPACWAGLR